ncbi:hypothetical protein Hanom_Chr06g00560291 [Helianthus anomalus]
MMLLIYFCCCCCCCCRQATCVLIGVYGGLLPSVATPVAAKSTLTRALLAMMMTRDVHLSLFILQRLDMILRSFRFGGDGLVW